MSDRYKKHVLIEESLIDPDPSEVIFRYGNYVYNFDTDQLFLSKGVLNLFELDLPFNSANEFIERISLDDRDRVESYLQAFSADFINNEFQNTQEGKRHELTFQIFGKKTNSKKALVTQFYISKLQNENSQYEIRGHVRQLDDTFEIIDHKEIEKINVLHESQKMANMGSWEYDLIKDKQKWSLGQCNIYEVEEHEAPKDFKEYLTFIHPDDVDYFINELPKLINGNEEVFNQVHYYRIIARKSQRVKTIKTVLKREIKNNKVVKLIGINLDITDSVDTENKLRLLTDNLKETQRIAKVADWIYYLETQELFWSEQLYDILEIPTALKPSVELYNSLIHEDDLTQSIKEFQSLLEYFEKNPTANYHGSIRMYTYKSKSIRYFTAITKPLFQGQKIIGFKGVNKDVTDETTSYQLLDQTEREYASIFSNSTIAIALVTEPGTFVSFNTAFERLTGYSHSELFESSLELITHPYDRNEERAKKKSLSKGLTKSFTYEKRIICKDQSIKWVSQTMSYISGYDNPTFLTQIVDITDRVNSEKKSFEYQLKFTTAFYGSAVGMILCDLTGKILEVNDSFCKIVGHQFSEIVNHNLSSILANEFSINRSSLLNQIIAGEIRNFTLEMQFSHKDGSMVFGLVTITLIKNAEGKNVNLIIQVQDISEQIENIHQINKVKLRFEGLFHNSGVGMAIVAGKQGYFNDVNNAFCGMLLYTKEELLGMRFIDITHPDDLKKSMQLSTALLSQELEQTTFEKKYIKKDGSTLYAIVTLTRIAEHGESDPFILAQIQNISDLVAERELREVNEKKFEYIVENADVGIGMSKKALVTYANPALLRMLGFKSLEEHKKVSLLDLANESTRRIIENRIKARAEGKKVPSRFIGEFKTKHGKQLTLEVISTNINFKGEVFQMAVINNLTHAMELQSKLRESQTTFNMAQKFANIGSWSWGIETNKIYWSESIYKIFEINANKSITYELFLSKVHPEDQGKVKEAISKCIESGRVYFVEHRIILKNGKIRWLAEHGNVIRDKQKRAHTMYGIVRDITKDKERDTELLLSKNKYQLLAESGHEVIGLHEPDGTFIYTSPFIKSLLGYSPNKIQSKLKLGDIIHAEDQEKYLLELSSTIEKNREGHISEIRLRDKKGKFIWCELSMKVLVDNGIMTIRSAIRDIENRIKYERQLESTNNQLKSTLADLKEASAAKENFLSIISHEIRTPLNSVIGLSNLLMRRSPRADQQEIMSTLKSSADNLMNLVNDILDFNKIRSGKLRFELISFSSTEFFQHLYLPFKVQAEDKGLSLNFSIDPRIPHVLKGDLIRLNQIFTNLLSNAIKFTPTGTVKFQAVLKSEDLEHCIIQFTITDTGVGIAEDKLESIFDVFQQSEVDTTRKYGGTGLGLSIVQSLVTLMSGKISVKSKLNTGSEFTITLPLIREIGKNSLTDETLKELALYNESISNNQRKLKVLYVEDVESNRFLIENLLADNHMECYAVASGMDALKLTANKIFDVILMDIQMPDMDGYETTTQIRNQKKGLNANTPILAFTAEPYSRELKKKTLLFKIQYLISKPFDFNLLLDKIRWYAKYKSEEMGEFSFDFYSDFFGHDPAKFSFIKKTIKNDIDSFLHNLKTGKKSKDYEAIKKEIHKMRPILKNLEAISVLTIIDTLRLHDSYTKEFELKIDRIIILTEIIKHEIGKI